MKRVVCIKNIDRNNVMSGLYLTIGKTYIVEKIHSSGNRYKLKNDKNMYYHYYKELFISLEEYRKLKLERLNEKGQ